ncbi:MAG: glycosyltransferase family 39 protein [Polyangiaceae bacterium]
MSEKRTATLAGPTLLDRALICGSVALIAFLLTQLLMFGYGRDQGIYAMVADAVVRGKMPYRDAWDFKPPGIFVVYAASRTLFGPAQNGIRILEALGLVLMSAAMVRLGERFLKSRSMGFVAAALAVNAHVQLDFWHTAQPESFGGMLTIFALLLAAPTEDQPLPGPRALFFAGCLFGMAGLLKPPLAGGGAVLALWLAHRIWKSPRDLPRRRRLKEAARPALFVAAGGVFPIFLCALWFLGRGALGDLHRVLFVFTPHYTRLGWEGSTLPGMVYWGFTEWLQNYGSSLTIGLLLALGFGADKKQRAWLSLFLGVVGIHLVGVIMQGKFFPYHYGATWPVTAMLAVYGFQRLRERLARWNRRGELVFAACLIVSGLGRSATKDVEDSFFKRCQKRVRIAWGGFRDQDTLDKLSSAGGVNADQNRKVAEWLRENTPADRPIFVWGFEPVIYDLADRRPASRFIYNVPQRVEWSKAPMRETLLRDLAATPPHAVVVEHGDAISMVTGDNVDSAGTLFDWWDFYVFLQKYDLVTTIDQMDVYIEKPSPASK